jgi:tetratricopeptide (TPR) repeat protein
MEKNGVIGYPTFLVLNPKGEVVGRWYGYSEDFFVKSTTEALADPVPFEEKIARYNKHPTESAAATLAHYHESKGDYREAIRLYADANRLAGTPQSEYLLGAFEATYEAVDQGTLTFTNLVASADALFGSSAVSPGDLLYPARAMVAAARDAGKPDDAIKYVKEAEEKSRGATDPDAMSDRARLLPDYALLVLKDQQKAIQYKKDSLADGWMEDPNGLNAFAWWCFQNNVDLGEGAAMARKGVTLAAPGGEKAQILDTLAEIRNALGDPQAALELTEQAIKEDPAGKHYQAQKKRFEALVAGQKPKS